MLLCLKIFFQKNLLELDINYSKIYEITLPNGEKHLSFKTNEEISFSSEKYCIASCSGLSADKKLIELRTIYSMDINDGYKLWTELRRYKDEATVGIGKM